VYEDEKATLCGCIWYAISRHASCSYVSVVKYKFMEGNRFCMYFVDLVAINLVSCRAITVGGLVGELTSSCMLGRDVLREATFYVTIWDWWSMVG
jgi:hypothetical protein